MKFGVVLFVLFLEFVSTFMIQHSPQPESDLAFEDEDTNEKISVHKGNDVGSKDLMSSWWTEEKEEDAPLIAETNDDVKSFSPKKTKSRKSSKSYTGNEWVSENPLALAGGSPPSSISNKLLGRLQFPDDEDLAGTGSGYGSGPYERMDAGTTEIAPTVKAPPGGQNNKFEFACNPGTEFQCADSGHCIPIQQKCDNLYDCQDMSDERDCEHSRPNVICTTSQFPCRSRDQCVPLSARCDGRYDCNDFSDEDCGETLDSLNVKTHPSLQTVKQGHEVVFLCRDEGPKRAPVSWSRGNGLPLPLGSIINNGRLEMPSIALESAGTYICEAVGYPAATPGATASVNLRVDTNEFRPASACKIDQATCTNGECIDKNMVCDGDEDCSDGSDEIRCRDLEMCEPNEFRCSNKRCLPKTWLCDGDDDCGDNTDELSCSAPSPGSPCRYNEFLCRSGNQCIPKMFHCDTEVDCSDQSDEFGCSPPVIKRPPLPLVTIDAGDTFNISCSAIGTPTPEIVWRLNWGHIPKKCTTSSVKGEGVLTCPNIRASDQGAYSCESINSLGTTFAIPDSILVVKAIDSSTNSSCPEGYYFEFGECKTCPCPGGGKRFGKSCFKGTDGYVTCNCLEGHVGRNCKKCSPGYQPSPDGCEPVSPPPAAIMSSDCNTDGSISPVPDKRTGGCLCKNHTTGRLCNECNPNSYHLSPSNLHGCISCFCMGITSQCSSSNWYRTQETASFAQNPQGFALADESQRTVISDGFSIDVGGRELGFKEFGKHPPEIYYWQLPLRFLGDKVTSYGGSLNYTVRYIPPPGGQNSPNSAADVEINGNDIKLLYFRKIPMPANTKEEITVPFLEQYWQNRDGQMASREHLLMVLANLTVLRIKATYTTSTREAYISDVILDYAVSRNTGQELAHAVEQCACPEGYTGLSCQDCALGYTRTLRGPYLGRCEPCFCNGHSKECDTGTGVCRNCRGNTTGDFCEHCEENYIRDPRTGRCTRETGPVSIEEVKCGCDARGSFTRYCPDGRNCVCKGNVEGPFCNLCMKGTFALQEGNPQGCLRCYCSSVSQECSSATLYRLSIDSQVVPGPHRFSLTNSKGTTSITEIMVDQRSEELAYSYPGSSRSKHLFWSLPPRFTGNRVTSYGGKLRATRRYETLPGGGSRKDANVSVKGEEDADVILIGSNGVSLIWTLRKSTTPGQDIELEVPLRETAGWRHAESSSNLASREDIMAVLSDLKSILIRASFEDSMETTYIKSVSLDDAVRQFTPNGVVMEVEECRCPPGYEGLSCESCSAGYYRDPKDRSRGVPGGSCHPCPCNENSDGCRFEYGRPVCICRPGFSGATCGRDGEQVPNKTITSPQIEVSVSDTLIQEEIGSSVTFRCRGRSLSGNQLRLSWSKEEGSIPSERSWDNGLGTLVINQVQPSDAGTFICTVTDGYNLEVERAILIVSEYDAPSKDPLPTQLEVTLEPDAIFANEGEQVEFKCTATGFPTPSITWTHSRSQTLPSQARVQNGILIIPSVRKSDEAEYICTARNLVGTESQIAFLYVDSRKEEGAVAPLPPPPHAGFTMSVSPPEYTAGPGEIVNFRCNSSDANATFQWSKLSEPLPESATSSPDGSLNIFFVRDSDSGIYVCTATSASGQVGQSEARLMVSSSSSPPIVRIEPDFQTVTQGMELEIRCNASGNPTPRIQWAKLGTPLAASVPATDSALRIPSAEVSDRGVYICTAENSAGKSTASAIVEVERREAPQVEIYPSLVQTVTQDGSAVFQCRASAGIPSPTISWSRAYGLKMPDNVEEVEGGVLRFNGVQGDERGQYICTADSVAGSATAVVTLKIQTPPTVFVSPSTPQTVQGGESVRLECRAEGDPLPSISWKLLQPGDAEEVELQGAAQSSGTVVYEIRRVKKADEGFYSCIARNDAGVAEERIQLLVLDTSEPSSLTLESSSQTKPTEAYEYSAGSRTVSNCIQPAPPRVMLQPIRQVVRRGDVVHIECLARGDQPMIISWSNVNRQPLPSHVIAKGPKLTFRGIEESDAGRYSCLAANFGGTAESVAEILVNGEEAGSQVGKSQHRSQQTAYVGSSTELLCLRKGGRVTWRKEGTGSLPVSAIPQGNLLKLIVVQLSDAGRYICESDEGSEIVDLTVESNRVPESTSFGSQIQVLIPEIMVQVGGSARFRCQGRSLSGGQLRVIWSKENGAVPRGRSMDGGLGLFIIDDARPEDSGTYLCSAADGDISKTERVILTVYEAEATAISGGKQGGGKVPGESQTSGESNRKTGSSNQGLLESEQDPNIADKLFVENPKKKGPSESSPDLCKPKKLQDGESVLRATELQLFEEASALEIISSRDSRGKIVDLLYRLYYQIEDTLEKENQNIQMVKEESMNASSVFNEADFELLGSVKSFRNGLSAEALGQIVNMLTRLYYFAAQLINTEVNNLGATKEEAMNVENVFTTADLNFLQNAAAWKNLISPEAWSRLLNLFTRFYFFVADIVGNEADKVGDVLKGGATNFEDVFSEGDFEFVGPANYAGDYSSRDKLSKAINLLLRLWHFRSNKGVTDGNEPGFGNEDKSGQQVSAHALASIYSNDALRKFSNFILNVYEFINQAYKNECKQLHKVEGGAQSYQNVSIDGAEIVTKGKLPAAVRPNDTEIASGKASSIHVKGQNVTDLENVGVIYEESEESVAGESKGASKRKNTTIIPGQGEAIDEDYDIEEYVAKGKPGKKIPGVSKGGNANLGGTDHVEVIYEDSEETIRGFKNVVKGSNSTDTATGEAGGVQVGGRNITQQENLEIIYEDSEETIGGVKKVVQGRNVTGSAKGKGHGAQVGARNITEETVEVIYEDSEETISGVKNVVKGRNVTGSAKGNAHGAQVGARNITEENVEVIYEESEEFVGGESKGGASKRKNATTVRDQGGSGNSGGTDHVEIIYEDSEETIGGVKNVAKGGNASVIDQEYDFDESEIDEGTRRNSTGAKVRPGNGMDESVAEYFEEGESIGGNVGGVNQEIDEEVTYEDSESLKGQARPTKGSRAKGTNVTVVSGGKGGTTGESTADRNQEIDEEVVYEDSEEIVVKGQAGPAKKGAGSALDPFKEVSTVDAGPKNSTVAHNVVDVLTQGGNSGSESTVYEYFDEDEDIETVGGKGSFKNRKTHLTKNHTTNVQVPGGNQVEYVSEGDGNESHATGSQNAEEMVEEVIYEDSEEVEEGGSKGGTDTGVHNKTRKSVHAFKGDAAKVKNGSSQTVNGSQVEYVDEEILADRGAVRGTGIQNVNLAGNKGVEEYTYEVEGDDEESAALQGDAQHTEPVQRYQVGEDVVAELRDALQPVKLEGFFFNNIWSTVLVTSVLIVMLVIAGKVVYTFFKG